MKNAKGSYVGKTSSPQFQTYPTIGTTPRPPAPTPAPPPATPTIPSIPSIDTSAFNLGNLGGLGQFVPPQQLGAVNEFATPPTDDARARLVNAIIGMRGGGMQRNPVLV